MRTSLLNKLDHRYTWRAKVGRFGVGHGKTTGPKLMLIDLHQKGSSKKIDHLWMNYTKAFARLNEFFSGDEIEFDATVEVYIKGGHKSSKFKEAYKKYQCGLLDFQECLKFGEIEKDFCLIRPTRVKLIHKIRLPKDFTRTETDYMNETQIRRFNKWHISREWSLKADEH